MPKLHNPFLTPDRPHGGDRSADAVVPPTAADAWKQRPRLTHLAMLVAAYVLAAGFAQLLAFIPDSGISIWPPSGVLVGTLIATRMAHWPWWVAAAAVAELIGNLLWFHNPIGVALLIFAGNGLEACAGARLVRRYCESRVRLESLREVLALVLLAAGIAPIISATIGSTTLAAFAIQPFVSAWPLWWIGDATGVLIFAPLTMVVLQTWQDKDRLSRARRLEAAVLALVFITVAALAFSVYLPFAYLVMLPLVWIAVRFEFKGAVVALALLALLTAVFAHSELSEFTVDPASPKQKHVMMQLFLAVSAFTVLVVAAISRQHHQAMTRLQVVNDELERRVMAQTANLRDRESRLRLALGAGKAGTWDRSFATGRMILSDGHFALLGLDRTPNAELSDATLLGTVLPEDLPALLVERRRAQEARDLFVAQYRIRRQDTGEVRDLHGTGQFEYGTDGQPTRFIGVAFDVTELKRHERRQQLLINELNHRVKNTLATVQSIAMQSLRGQGDAGTRDDFIGRLAALAGGHDLLAQQSWEGAGLAELVDRTVAAYQGGERTRIVAQGPEFVLPPRQALAITMALHELCTNAAKYGALSNDVGSVRIDWTPIDDGARFRLIWQESGGPPVVEPARRGFGSRLLERGLKQDLVGDIQMEFRPTGVVCTIEAPVPGPAAPRDTAFA